MQHSIQAWSGDAVVRLSSTLRSALHFTVVHIQRVYLLFDNTPTRRTAGIFLRRYSLTSSIWCMCVCFIRDTVYIYMLKSDFYLRKINKNITGVFFIKLNGYIRNYMQFFLHFQFEYFSFQTTIFFRLSTTKKICSILRF